MLNDITKATNAYSKYTQRILDLRVNDKNGFRKVINLDKAFLKEYKEKSTEINKTLGEYEKEFNENNTLLIQLNEEVEKEKSSYQALVPSYHQCITKLTAYNNKLKKEVSGINKKFTVYKGTFNSYIKRIKSEKKTVAKYKKKKNRSNWPPDKKKYKKKAKKAANKAKKYANQATAFHKKVSAEKTKIDQSLAKKQTAGNKLKSECQAIAKQLNSIKVIIDGHIAEVTSLSAKQLEIKENIAKVKSDNAEFYLAYEKYIEERKNAMDEFEARSVRAAKKFNKIDEYMVKKYGEKYFDTYKSLIAWLTKNEINGEESLHLLDNLGLVEEGRIFIKKLRIKILAVLKATNKNIADSLSQPKRSIASVSLIHIEIGGIKVPKLPNLNFKLPNLNLEVPNLNLTLPDLSTSIPNIDMAHSLNLPKIEMNSLEVVDLNSLRPEEITNLSVDGIMVPKINIINISTNVKGDLLQFMTQIKDIRIDIPKVKIVHISADTEEDLKNPGKILENVKNEAERGIHDAGKNLGDAMKYIRNRIAMMQGVDIEEILKNLRKEIKSCRENRSKLNNITLDLENLNAEIKTEISLNPGISQLDLQKQMQQKIKSLEHFKVGSGQAGGLALSFYTTGATGSTAMNSSVVMGCGYVAFTAAVVIVMMESVTNEIEHEQDKLSFCAEKYGKVYNRYQLAYNEYLAMLNRGADYGDEVLEINQKYTDLFTKYITCTTLSNSCKDMSSIIEERDALIKKVETLVETYPELAGDVTDTLLSDLKAIK